MNIRKPSYWITVVLLVDLAVDRFHLNFLEVLGASFLYGFAVTLADLVIPDAWHWSSRTIRRPFHR